MFQGAARQARRALDVDDKDTSARLWHELLGDPFPLPPDTGFGQGHRRLHRARGSLRRGHNPIRLTMSVSTLHPAPDLLPSCRELDGVDGVVHVGGVEYF